MKTIVAVEACDLSPDSFDRLAEYITVELGIKMPASKFTMLRSRLFRRARELDLNSLEEYREYLFDSSNVEEREHFINVITTNKTEFFREPAHFELLTRVVLPSVTRGAGSRLKVWSAGCSSGEEPYTIAMVLSEHALSRPSFDYAILGTDISTKVLERAHRGIYQESQVAPVPSELRRKYLRRSRDDAGAMVRIVPELREKLTLHFLNFMDDDYRIKDLFDVVFFRNVLIYFDRSTQGAVINKICRNLAPGGYLFIGHSESLSGLDVPLRPVGSSVFRKLP
jgi:chemotaxis protein methyltransferase CheR